MRLRKVKNALEKLNKDNCYFVSNPKDYKGKWNEIFGNDNPIRIEIGCGKGQFISQLAVKYPDINFIAIEKFDSVLLRCLEKVNDSNIPNLKLALIDAASLVEYFGNGEVSAIYINFSDPWPKYAHRKRRLTYKSFLESYYTVLNNDGVIYQKTDNRKLFEFSLESFNENGWLLSNISLDLHKDNDEDNITTEFEDKWSKLGPIYRLEARKRN